jgi:hypothetical protein
LDAAGLLTLLRNCLRDIKASYAANYIWVLAFKSIVLFLK